MAWFKKKQDPISQRARELKKQIADLEGEIRKLSVQQSRAESHSPWPPPENRPPAPTASAPSDSAGPTQPPPRTPTPPKTSPDKGSIHSFAPDFSVQTPSKSKPRTAPPAGFSAHPAPPAAPAPKLRSTARPQSPTVFLPKADPFPDMPSSASAPEDPIFEEVGQNPFRAGADQSRAEIRNHLDIRRNDLTSMWRRFKSNFRGPATSNPKLVNYLAAGSIQGLRPLRYERRVARNRFLVLVVVLIVVLWGIVTLIFFR